MSDKQNIHTAMLQVYGSVGYVQKSGRNDKQNYRYAGEADLIGALRPALVEAGIVFWCSDIRDVHTREIRKMKGNGDEAMTINTAATFTFTFAHAESGTSITVQARGEGSDSLDKASYKAMTGALKYALRQSFVIETGDDPDGAEPTDTPPEYRTYDEPAPRSRPNGNRDPLGSPDPFDLENYRGL